jgi:hypothetical protein
MSFFGLLQHDLEREELCFGHGPLRAPNDMPDHKLTKDLVYRRSSIHP